jgi:hypothetical protein
MLSTWPTVERRRKGDKFVGEAVSFRYSVPHVDCRECSEQDVAKLSGSISFWLARKNPARQRCIIF